MRNDLKRLKRFFSLFQTQWIPYAMVTLVVASRNFMISYLNATISSTAVAIVASGELLFHSVIRIALLVVCFAVMDAGGVYLQTTVIHKITMTLREKMFSHSLGMAVPDMDRFGGREELVSRMNFDIDNATALLSYGILTPVMYGISGIGTTVILWNKSRKICAMVYAFGLLAFLAQIFFSGLIRRHMTEIQREKAAVASVSMQTFLESAGIKMAGLTDYVSRMHQSGLRRYARAFSRKGVVDGACGAVRGALQMVCFSGVFCYALFGEGMAPGDAVFLSQLAPLIATMLLSVSDCILNVRKSLAGTDRILELFDFPTEEDVGEAFTVQGRVRSLETSGLVCRYRDKEVRIGDIRITDISIHSGDGDIVALKGSSGCGKTTLVRLLLKLYPYAAGSLRFFGQDIDRCSRSSIRKNIAYVPQENMIFPGTLRENILLGNHRGMVTDEEISAVLEQIGADEWVGGKGLDSVMKENGGNLSGGQCQMIAIARALLYRKPVLILDEAFASMDEEHIGKIMTLLHEMRYNSYVVVVTHDSRILQKCSVVVEV